MIICADDYGFKPDANRAILELAGLRRISAVSCMVCGPAFTPEAVGALQQHEASLDIGLHFSLNELPLMSAPQDVPALLDAQQQPLTFFALMRRCYLRQVPAQAARGELALQYERFCSAFGRPPDFIDGHLHVQQLPGIREGFLDFVCNLPAGQRPYVRNSRVKLSDNLAQGVSVAKTFFIALPGAAMERAARQRGLRTNNGFAGIYNYAEYQKFPLFLQKFAGGLRAPNGLMMAHPGLDEGWRRMEYETLRDTPLAQPQRFSAAGGD